MTSNQDFIIRKCYRCFILLPVPHNTYSYYLLTISHVCLYLCSACSKWVFATRTDEVSRDLCLTYSSTGW